MTSRTEDEDLAQIKDWWQRNGKPLVTGGILALAVVFGWQAWQKYQTNQAQGASIVYQQLIETALNPAGQPDPAKVAEPGWQAEERVRRHPLCPVRQPVRGQGRGRQRQAG